MDSIHVKAKEQLHMTLNPYYSETNRPKVMDWSNLGLSAEKLAAVQKVYKFTEEFFRNPRFDASHDFRHVKRVTSTAVALFHKEQALRLSNSLALLNPLTVVLGALLHDVEDRKYVDAKNTSTRLVMTALLQAGLSNAYADRIRELVHGVSYSSEVKDPEAVQRLIGKIPELAVVQDADRLDAIGAIGIGRCFTFGGAKARTLENSIKHFRDKLLKLEGMMKTESGKQMATERSRRIREFMSWWEDEINPAEHQNATQPQLNI